ncbi:hypothetical protein HZA43_03795, partial [Candidatus Peregrinibacteria bacterium]|nr:hypothetical protein [Candidatus Peregrinibacteria bacterium]
LRRLIRPLESEAQRTSRPEMGQEKKNDELSFGEFLKPARKFYLYANMFEFKIPKDRYDLIISISTIHHGSHEQVQDLIHGIHGALMENGRAFITVPDFESGNKRGAFKGYEKIGKGTFNPLSGPEKGLPHSFYREEGVRGLFSKFKILRLNLDDIGRWVVWASK